MIRTTVNHLRRNSGKEIRRYRIRDLSEVQHLYQLDKATFWCAWAGERIIGMAAALTRGEQWYLGFLFVEPRYQNKGVGKSLLRKVWRDDPHFSHSLSTFAYNVQAVGIYSQFGMAPLCAFPIMGVALKELKRPAPTGLRARTNLTVRDFAWIRQLEKIIRGYEHPQEWRFWSCYNEVQIYMFEDKGRRVGYSMVYKYGAIAPAGAISNEYLRKVVAETLRLAKIRKKAIRMCCPAHNFNLYRFLIDCGFRLLEMDLFMTDRPYADFQRYVPAQLAIF
jgi:GNAT superfamily N-acetyltransferase